MGRSFWPRGLPWLLLVGCFSSGPKPTTLVSPASSFPKDSSALKQVAHVPGTEATATRVAKMGQKILQTNPQVKLHPAFTTIGAPQPEIFHRGSNETSQIVITEALVRQCQSDGQLAAVLCQELGKMVSEQMTQLNDAMRLASQSRMPEMRIGTDQMGSFGPADGSDRAFMALQDRKRPAARMAPLPPPPPEVLASGYLRNAGFPPDDLKAVKPLLRKADKNMNLEKSWNGWGLGK